MVEVKRKNSRNPFQNVRRRDVVGSNGLLQQSLMLPCPIGTTSKLRQDISAFARASEIDRREGRTSLHTRTLQAGKYSPSAGQLTAADDAYLVYQTFAQGSLARLLLSAHALGFRFFPKSSAASAFLSASKIITQEKLLLDSLTTHELQLSQLSISSLYDSLSTGIRGKGDNTETGPLVVRFYTTFTGKPLSKNNESPEKAFCEKLAEAVVNNFTTWKEFTSDPVATYILLKPLFDSKNIYSELETSIQQLHEDSSQTGALSNRTIVFDHSLPTLDIKAKPEKLLIALCARYAQEAKSLNLKSGAHIKSSLTTVNGNGLGWFYNKAFELLPDTKNSDEELMNFIGCDRSHPALQKLIELISAIKEPSLFSDVGYSDLRSSIQGDIDSFISNHIARLESSIDMLESSIASVDDLIQSITANYSLIEAVEGLTQLPEIIAELPATLNDGLNAAKVLAGKTNDTIVISVIDDAAEKYSDCLNQINYVQSAVKTINGAIKRLQLPNKAIDTPTQWNDLISLPTLGEPVVSIEHDRESNLAQFNSIKTEYRSVIAELGKNYSMDFDSALLNMQAKYIEGSKKTKHPYLIDPKVVAFRECLSRLTSVIFRGSNSLRSISLKVLFDTGIFASRQDLSDQLYQRKYVVFVSPYNTDKRPRKILELTSIDVNLLHVINTIIDSTGITEADRDNLNFIAQGILLNSLPEKIPTIFVSSDIVKTNGDYRMRCLLVKPEIERNIAIHLLNTAYQSKLNGLRYKLNKTKFCFTRTLTPYLESRLIYLPKIGEWKIPAQFAEGRFKSIVESPSITWARDGVIDVEPTAYKLAKDNSLIKCDVIAFLRELPHRFFMNTGIRSSKQYQGLLINNGDISIKTKMTGLVPLSLTPENKPLIRAVNSLFEGGKVSPPAIQFERNYHSINGVLQEDTSARRIIFQLPTSTNTVAGTEGWQATNLLAIDPGVNGMGISVLSIDTGLILDSGFVAVKSLKNFTVKKTTHREITTPRQQYKSKFSHHLSDASDAAVGDICHIIERLMHEYNALPIFEMPSDDGKDPSTQVWNKVVSLYTWGDNDSQNNERKSHWFGATHWDTGLLRTAPLEKKPKPFVGYPGAKISAYGNSQVCSCCGRNVIETLRETVKSQNEISVNDSTAILSNGTVFFENPDPESAHDRKAKGLPPLWVPVGNREFKNLSSHSESAKDLIVMAQRSIRRAPQHKKKTQGTESVFKCPYVDCAITKNAEANASENVAKKFYLQLAKPE